MIAVFVVDRGRFQIWNGDEVVYECAAFAGNARGRNNPLCENMSNFGPLPAGSYAVRMQKHPRFHPPAFRLIPTGQEMFGRSGFWLHGGTLSHGCCVVGLPARKYLATHPVERLIVVHHQIAAGVDLISDAQLTPPVER